jgi:UDP-glucose 4-epimerase
MRRFLHTDIKEIRIFSRDEKKQEDLRINYGNPKLKFSIGDVRSMTASSMLWPARLCLPRRGAQTGSFCEFYPLEALRTNALGAENVLNAAMETGVKRVIT